MPYSEEDKKYIINEFLRIITLISDEIYQKKRWIHGEGPDFDETVCQFFDYGEPILKKYKDYGITDNQYNLLTAFFNDFGEFSSSNYLPEEFISSPEWKRIMEMAKEILKAFNYQGNE